MLFLEKRLSFCNKKAFKYQLDAYLICVAVPGFNKNLFRTDTVITISRVITETETEMLSTPTGFETLLIILQK